jgi:hypothetical protein
METSCNLEMYPPSACVRLKYQDCIVLDDRITNEYGAVGGKGTDRGNPSSVEKTRPIVTLSTTNPM